MRAREEACLIAAQAEAEKYGNGVTADAQEIFFALSKTYYSKRNRYVGLLLIESADCLAGGTRMSSWWTIFASQSHTHHNSAEADLPSLSHVCKRSYVSSAAFPRSAISLLTLLIAARGCSSEGGQRKEVAHTFFFVTCVAMEICLAHICVIS